jgi:hypothetical protein
MPRSDWFVSSRPLSTAIGSSTSAAPALMEGVSILPAKCSSPTPPTLHFLRGASHPNFHHGKFFAHSFDHTPLYPTCTVTRQHKPHSLMAKVANSQSRRGPSALYSTAAATRARLTDSLVRSDRLVPLSCPILPSLPRQPRRPLTRNTDVAGRTCNTQQTQSKALNALGGGFSHTTNRVYFSSLRVTA